MRFIAVFQGLSGQEFKVCEDEQKAYWWIRIKIAIEQKQYPFYEPHFQIFYGCPIAHMGTL